MKKYLFFFLVLIVVTCKAQDAPGIYYNGKKLGYSRMVGKRVGNALGAYMTMGLTTVKINRVVEGATAELEVTEKKPEFKVVFGEKDFTTGFIFTDRENLNRLLLVKLSVKKKNRNLNVGKYGITKIKTQTDEDNLVQLAIDQTDENTYTIHPREELEEGTEYCFYYRTDKDDKEEHHNFDGVFDFKTPAPVKGKKKK